VALLAEALGIPTVAEIPDLMRKVTEQDLLLVDGFNGFVIVNPDAATQARCQVECQGARERRVQLIREAQQAVRTRDGVAVSVMANVSRLEDTTSAAENGADGVGLCRLEGFYMSRKTPPTAQELLTELQRMFVPMAGKPLTIRLLDVGGDKPMAFLKLARENNPFLGQRGVRVLLGYPDLLDVQLQALCRFSQEQAVRILVPMVTFAEDMAQVRNRLEMVARSEAIAPPPLGAMIETPGAALSITDIKKLADFLSVGTNDLTQYTFAAGRENPLVSDYYQQGHPAILRLLKIIVEEAGDLKVGVCGELARQEAAIPALLRLGIRELSVAAPLVPDVKQLVRRTAL
jgi:phosphoenolpyruvate-protein kinase (PTS system EI component)